MTILSPKQLEVMQLVAEGHPTKMIAFQLDKAESTVKVQIRQICDKYGVANRVQAVLAFLRESGRLL